MLTLSTEEKQFISRLEDLLDRVEERYQQELTDFLEPRLQLVAEEYLRSRRFTRYLLCGGYAGAERRRLLLYPDYSEASCQEADIRLYRFRGKMEYVSVTHRDYLGAIMSLGLRREKFGDLLVNPDGCDLFIEAEVADYLLQNPLRVKHVPLAVEELTPEAFVPPEQQKKELPVMLSSMRLDTVLAHGLGLSRSKAVELIRGGLVKVNHSEIRDTDHICREEDLISCRGKGRLRIGQSQGETKKGKTRLSIWKYL